MLVLALSCGAVFADPPKAPPAPVDDEFLEFLGSVDSEPIRPEDLWLVDYWSKPAPNPGARPPAAAKPAPPAPKPSPPPAGTQNNG